ncbi:MAG: YfjI family protein, partial [Prevotella sp.]|nr:YfjI family protein [Prevotella sp.]
RSANKGYHLAFRRHPEMTQEENLKWASQLLGVEFDKGAKDITRVFFTPPSDHILYLSDELFDNSECNAPAPQQPTTNNPQPITHNQQPTTDNPQPTTAYEECTATTRHAFDLCVEQAGLTVEALDAKGSRHSNLMAILSVGLPKLVSRPQLESAVRERMPSYAQEEECKKLIDYFYTNYTADKGYMTISLREINAKAQQLAAQEAKTDDETMEALTQEWDPPRLPDKLPRLLELLVGNYDKRFREMLLMSALPVLSAHASHYRSVYLNGKMIGPQQYVAVIGASGSGKGNCTDLFREMVKHTLQDNDTKEWAKVKENAELRDKQANAKVRPPKYHPKLRLFETTSKSSILELQTNLGANGMLLGQFSEVDGLSSSSRSAYSDISVLLRKGWDGDMHRQFYMSDSTCNTYTQMSISLLMAGTPKAMLERMFGESNCEGGLMQRCIPVLVPKSERTFRPPVMNHLEGEELAERDALLLQLYQQDLACGEDTKLLQLPRTRRAIGSWFDELEQRYNDGQLTEAEADLSHRCGEFMMRAAIPLVALYGKETNEIVNFARWVGETAHYNMCRIFGQRVMNNILDSEELVNAKIDHRKTAEPLLTCLPNVFTIKQFQDVRVKNGQSSNVKFILHTYCQNNKIKRISRGVYQKL